MKRINKKTKPYFSGYKNLLLITIVIVGCVSLLSKLTEYSVEIKEITYTQFDAQVKLHTVKKLYVDGSIARGEFTDGTF